MQGTGYKLKSKGNNALQSVLYPLLKGLPAALWLSILFLPFKGINAALILFALLSVSIILLKAFWIYRRTLIEIAHTVKSRVRGIKVSAKSLKIARYSAILFLLSFPFFVRDYLLDIAILSGIYAILAIGLNVIVGFTGLLNLGFAAFYAIGAYTYALFNVKLGLGFWQSLPFSIGLTALSGFILAVPALRLKGDYLAIVTLGFGEIIHLVINNWDSLTNGPNGISGIDVPYVFGMSMGGLNKFYYITLFAVMFAYIVVKRIRLSRIGRAWIAIREDEIGASTTGINTTRFKLYAFAFGSLWAGLAGALFAAKMQFVSPESFTFVESVLILSMVILGGLGNIKGVIIGAVIMVILPELLREVQSYRMLVLGIGLIAMMVFRPQGLLSGIRNKA